MRFFIILGLLLVGFTVKSQVDLTEKTYAFYTSINKGDSTEIASYFHPKARVMHVTQEEVWDVSLSEFLEVCPKFKSNYYSEEISSLTITEFPGGLIYMDIYFDFYIEGSYSHSGLDHFCWTIRAGELKIENIYSTRLIDGLPKIDDKKSMDKRMNKWHNDVAVFDKDAYFGFMAKDFIYLGTDPSERWTKESFMSFCTPYFDRKSTWDFKTNWRNWYFSTDQKTAWFEESLDTQMEECRGSGVLIKEDGKWKIAHYNLAVVIENKKMKKFIKLRKK